MHPMTCVTCALRDARAVSETRTRPRDSDPVLSWLVVFHEDKTHTRCKRTVCWTFAQLWSWRQANSQQRVQWDHAHTHTMDSNNDFSSDSSHNGITQSGMGLLQQSSCYLAWLSRELFDDTVVPSCRHQPHPLFYIEDCRLSLGNRLSLLGLVRD